MVTASSNSNKLRKTTDAGRGSERTAFTNRCFTNKKLALVDTSANYKGSCTRLCWEHEREHCLHQQRLACCAKNKWAQPHVPQNTSEKASKTTKNKANSAHTAFTNMGKLQQKAGTSCSNYTDKTAIQMSGEGASTRALPTYKTTTGNG